MQVRSFAFVGLAVLVCAGLIALLLEVRADPEEVISEDDIARARQRHAKNTAPTSIETSPGPESQREREVRERQTPRPAASERATPSPSPTTAAPSSTPSTDPSDFATRARDASQVYYDGDYPAALEMAKAILEDDPDNVFFQRVTILSACAVGETETARTYYNRLEEGSETVSLIQRCRKYGVNLVFVSRDEVE